MICQLKCSGIYRGEASYSIRLLENSNNELKISQLITHAKLDQNVDYVVAASLG